jgi:hypothetical protein
VFDDAGAEALQYGQKLVAYAGAQIARVAIRGVDGMREAVAGDVGLNVATPRPIERANAIAVARWQYGEAARPGASKKAKEHRLGAVVGVVAGRDSTCAHPSGRCPESVPTRGACARLEVTSGLHIHAGARKGDVERTRKSLDEVELRGRLRSKTMVDTVCKEAECESTAEQGEHVQHRRRVGTTAHRCENDRSARDQAAIPQCSAREGDERGRVRARHARERGFSTELKLLAKLELGSGQRLALRRGRVAERALQLGVPKRVGAVLAREAKMEMGGLAPQTRVHPGLHDLRSSDTTLSTWLVCGNISNVATD